jgi:hypothetical protein
MKNIFNALISLSELPLRSLFFGWPIEGVSVPREPDLIATNGFLHLNLNRICSGGLPVHRLLDKNR